ncbi:MAG: hypothetical protein ACYCO0_01295 [Candidatus Micrarchaeaceae archaeon]
MGEKREKFYTVSARLVFSSIIVILLIALAVGLSLTINKGQILPLLGVKGGAATPPVTTVVSYSNNTATAPIIISVGCTSLSTTYKCLNPSFNLTSRTLTVALSQDTGYNWTSVTVMFVTSGTAYSNGIPELSWSPPLAVNVTGGLLSNATKYINIPITSGPVSVGSNITGSIWTKYQLQVGGGVSYANMSSAHIVVYR